MPVAVTYAARDVLLPGGRGAVMLSRTVRVEGDAQGEQGAQGAQEAGASSRVEMVLTPGDARSLSSAHRARATGSFAFEDAGDGGWGGDLAYEHDPWEQCVLYWTMGDLTVEDDMRSDWCDAFMEEVRLAAERALARASGAGESPPGDSEHAPERRRGRKSESSPSKTGAHSEVNTSCDHRF